MQEPWNFVHTEWKQIKISLVECDVKILNNFKRWCVCICHLNWMRIRARLSKFHMQFCVQFEFVEHFSFSERTFFYWLRSDVVHSVKLAKTKKLFAFPKKSKHMQLSSAKSTTHPPFNVSHFLTTVSLAQIQQMISFLVLDQSKASPIRCYRIRCFL